MIFRDVFNNFVAGSVGGGVGIFCGQPLDVVKVRMQANQNSNVSLFRTLGGIVRNETFAGLYRGMVPPLIGQVLYSSVAFGGYSLCLQLVEKQYNTIEQRQKYYYENIFLAGCGSGVLTVLACCPMEIVKVRLQMNSKAPKLGDFREEIKRIYTSKRILGFYTGFSITCIRDSPGTGLYFIIYYYSKDLFKLRTSWSDTQIELLGGGLSGALTWYLVTPFDVIKTRLQAQTLYKETLYSGMVDCGKKIIEKEGVRGLFKGSTAIVLRAFPVNAVTFYIYERMLEVLVRIP